MYLIQKNPKYIIELSRPNELSSLFWCGKQDGWQPDEKKRKTIREKGLKPTNMVFQTYSIPRFKKRVCESEAGAKQLQCVFVWRLFIQH